MRHIKRQGFFICRISCLLALALQLFCSDSAAQEPPDVDSHYWICEYNFQTAKSTRLFAVPQLNSAGSVSYSSDGTRIAFDGGVPGKHSTSNLHVFVCNADGSEMKDLGPGTMPSWSPRGKRIAFSRYSPEHGVWMMNADGSDAQLLDNQGWSAVWSPNGNMIAYRRRLKTFDDFVIFNLVEDEFTTVFGDADSGYSSFNWNFAWSPDSNRICFKGTFQESAQIGVVDIASPQQMQVLMQSEYVSSDFSWRNNASIITSMRSADVSANQLYELNATSSKSAPVLIEGQFTDRANSDPDVSTDGRTMLYISRPPVK